MADAAVVCLNLFSAVAFVLFSLLVSVSIFFNKRSAYLAARETKSQESISSKDHLPPSSGHDYEVFLSFRGTDTRKGFTDCLYHSLKDAGVRVFRDNEELRKGEEIGPLLKQALEQSRISIPIFSKNYASSKWCLKELVFMVECRNAGTQLILPIFYDVTPSEVRHQLGSYAKSFQKHERRYERPIVQQWRDAFAEVGSLAGWELQNVANGHQGELIKLVVTKVMRELKMAHLRVVDTLVGINHHVEAVMRLLDVGAKDVKIVGISGMGGIGKTTIAKVVYNKVVEHFEWYAFLEDIRESSSQQNGLKYLQSLLLANILRHGRQDFASTDEGSNELSRLFRDKKVLILLDDVDDTTQVNALIGGADWFGPGSRIIITTRNTDVLNANQVLTTYEVEALSQDHALQLFCKHSFKDDFPTSELSDLCKDIVRTTGGLPLALEVIGSFVFGKRKAIWEDTLEKLKRIPDKRVLDKLKISYDALDHQQKQIFLDIACFFIGVDVRIVAHFWKGCQFYPEVGIEVLLIMSLIKIGEDNKLWMHDQLRDLGREIVQQENYKEAAMRSRVWDSTEAFTILERFKGTEYVEAICLHSKKRCAFGSGAFKHLPRLRFLQLEDAELYGDFEDGLPSLRWLSWQVSPFARSFINLGFHVLVILDLSGSKVNEDWSGWNSMQIFVRLKVLDLSSCHQLTKTPSFSMFPNLEVLTFEGCQNLAEVDSSIMQLKELISLNLKHCVSLKELPQELGCLEKLTELFLDETFIRTMPVSEGMKELKTLNAKGCIGLTQVPASISHLTSLSNLIMDSSGVRELPDSIGSLAKLQRLSINNCWLRELPGAIGQLKSLIELSISGTGVATLPDSIGNLGNLKVLKIDFSDIEFLPTAIGRLRKLEILNATGCHHLKGEIPPEIGRLFNLKVLRLDCTKIDSIPTSIAELLNLEILHLTECHMLQALPLLPVGLISVRVTCNSVVPIPNLTDLINLRELGFVNCGLLVELPQNITRLSRLEKLELVATNISNLPDGIGDLPQLRILNIQKPSRLARLPALPSILSKLNVTRQRLLSELPDLAKLRNLSELYIKKCFSLTVLPGLKDLVLLTSLIVTFCPQITKLDDIERLTSLRCLDISDNENLKRLPDLSNLKKLSVIKASGCEKLIVIQGLDSLHGLEHLDITNCIAMKKLPDLSSLELLRSLSANGCKNLRELGGLDKLESLSSLHLSGCTKIKYLPDLSKLNKLRHLDIAGCGSITDYKVLSKVLLLENVTVSGLNTLAKFQTMPRQINVRFPPRGTTSYYGNLVKVWHFLRGNTSNGFSLQLSRDNTTFFSKMSARECHSHNAHYRTPRSITVANIERGVTAIYPSKATFSLNDGAVFYSDSES